MALALRIEAPGVPRGPASGGTAVIFGWGGAHRRQLADVERLYQRLGARTLVVVPPLQRLIRPAQVERDDRVWAQRILETIREGEPVWVHAFSHNGALGLMRLLEQPEARGLRFGGVIFDSAPGLVGGGRFRPYRFARSLAAALRAMVRVRSLWARTLVALFSSAAAHLWLAGFAHRIRPYYERYRFALREAIPETVPLQLIYGDLDAITPWAEVERYGERMLERGNPVYSRCFKGSGHLRHRRLYPQQYEDLIRRFVALASAPERPLRATGTGG